MSPLTGDGQFRDVVVRIAELTVNTSTIEDLTFSNCRIIGPAVLALITDVEMIDCSWDAPNLDAIRWQVEPGRFVVGAVGVQRCIFSNCRFEGVGLAGTAEMFEALREGFAG